MVDRFLVRHGYQFDKWVFRGYAVIVVLYVLFTFYSFDFDFSQQIYLKCDGLYACENPLFLQCDKEVCYKEFLPPGYEYGVKPDRFLKYLYGGFVVAFLGGLLALAINHFWHNKGKSFLVVE